MFLVITCSLLVLLICHAEPRSGDSSEESGRNPMVAVVQVDGSENGKKSDCRPRFAPPLPPVPVPVPLMRPPLPPPPLARPLFPRRGFFVDPVYSRTPCRSNLDCYDQREPSRLCRISDGFSWSNRGCFCDENLRACVIEFMNPGPQWTYCARTSDWRCPPEASYVQAKQKKS